jgi:hypothetical protein
MPPAAPTATWTTADRPCGTACWPCWTVPRRRRRDGHRHPTDAARTFAPAQWWHRAGAIPVHLIMNIIDLLTLPSVGRGSARSRSRPRCWGARSSSGPVPEGADTALADRGGEPAAGSGAGPAPGRPPPDGAHEKDDRHAAARPIERFRHQPGREGARVAMARGRGAHPRGAIEGACSASRIESHTHEPCPPSSRQDGPMRL